MRLLGVIAALLLLAFPSALKADEPTIAGLGTRSCGGWTEDRKANAFDATNDQSWVMGFLSGVALTGGDYNPLNNTDALGVWAWIDNYCQANPLDEIYQAGEAFVKFHPK